MSGQPEGYFRRGDAFYRLGQFRQAIADFSQWPQAAADFSERLRWRPGDTSVLNDRGSCYEHLGRYAEAQECRDQARGWVHEHHSRLRRDELKALAEFEAECAAVLAEPAKE
jgi:tetratricopeptide (TPR) repeat protein